MDGDGSHPSALERCTERGCFGRRGGREGRREQDRVPSGARAAPSAFPGLARAVPGGGTGISFLTGNWEHWERRAVSPREEPGERDELGVCAAQGQGASGNQQGRPRSGGSSRGPQSFSRFGVWGSPAIPKANSCRFSTQEKMLGGAGMAGAAQGGTCGASVERGRTVPEPGGRSVPVAGP